MNILLIEDDAIFAKHLMNSLKKQEAVHRVTQIDSVQRFVDGLSEFDQYDIILLDLSLKEDIPGKPGGLMILRTIRQSYHDTPVIIISAHENIDLMEQTLNLGANDYITKGIRLTEIKLRVVHWFRLYCMKSLHLTDHFHEYAGIHYNTETQTITYGGQELDLSRGNHYILSLFLLHPGRLLSERYIAEKVWGRYDPDNTQNLRVTIARLRKSLERYKLEDWIENQYGEGYILQQPHKTH